MPRQGWQECAVPAASSSCTATARPAFDPLADILRARLQQRHDELLALLQAASGAAMAAAQAPGEVRDFKDAAAEESQLAVEEASLAAARQQLAQVKAALARLADGSYGWCEDCGDPIDERRLLALPATVCCTACQGVRERLGRRPPLR